MCESDTDISSVAKQNFIRWITPSEEFPDIVDPFSDLYKSSDYSKDKTYSILQKSTKGKGINIVIMGDAYSDRLINDGTYNNDLSGVIDNIFKEEPLRSLKEYFNVYICFAVSENESPQAVTAFDLILKAALALVEEMAYVMITCEQYSLIMDGNGQQEKQTHILLLCQTLVSMQEQHISLGLAHRLY